MSKAADFIGMILVVLIFEFVSEMIFSVWAIEEGLPALGRYLFMLPLVIELTQ